MSAYEIRPMKLDDRERVAHIGAQSFHLPAPTEKAIDYYQPDQWVVVEDRTGVQAALQILDSGQYYGGRAVPTAHVHALMVSAETRGKGYGKALLTHGLVELAERNVALSALVASVSQVYRRSGYEYAGTRVRYGVAVDQIVVGSSTADVEPFGDAELDDVKACYDRVAGAHNGPVVRPDWWWQARVLRRHKRELVHRYLVRDAQGEVRGYVVYTHEKDPGRFAPEFVADDIGYPYRIVARDFVWETLEAAQAILALVARHGAVATDFSWLGPVNEPLSTLIPSRDLRIESSSPWMVRVVDAKAALESRGYPAHAQAAVQLVLTDPVGSKSTPVRLEVADGKAEVSVGDGTGFRTDVGALGAMYTSWLAPADAVRVGRLVDASPSDLAALTMLFAGPAPWTYDLF